LPTRLVAGLLILRADRRAVAQEPSVTHRDRLDSTINVDPKIVAVGDK
jgi:hypothetical protein